MPCAAAEAVAAAGVDLLSLRQDFFVAEREEAAAEAHQSAPFVACLHALMRGRATALVCRMIVDVLFGSWTHSTKDEREREREEQGGGEPKGERVQYVVGLA